MHVTASDKDERKKCCQCGYFKNKTLGVASLLAKNTQSGKPPGHRYILKDSITMLLNNLRNLWVI